MALDRTRDWEALHSTAHAWRLDLDSASTAIARLARRGSEWLSALERERLARLRTAAARNTYLVTRALCRLTLSRYADVEPARWTFGERRHGKPFVASPARFRSLRFNLTHTDGLIVCLVSRAGDVGVDAEQTSRSVDVAQVARHFFSADDRARLDAAPKSSLAARFFETWVLKEAYLKARGVGLTRAPESFTIRFDDHHNPRRIGAWEMALHHPTKHHVVATAVKVSKTRASVPIVWHDARELL